MAAAAQTAAGFTIDPAPEFEADVPVHVPGAAAAVPVRMRFRHQGRRALRAWIEGGKARADDEWLADVVAGWAGVVDAAGEPVPYTRAALGRMLDAYPGVGADIYDAYLAELFRGRTGNS